MSKSSPNSDDERLDQAELLDYVTDAVERLGLRYAITGSHASIAYGENRFTNDIDVVIELTQEQLPQLLGVFSSDRFCVSEDGARHAAAHGGQFNVIDNDTIQKVDLIVPRDVNWPDQFPRRIRMQTGRGREAWFVSPEDLILKKMDFYREGGSEKHLRDIAGVLKVSDHRVDRNYITEWAARLGLSDIWKQILSQLQ